MSGVNPEGSRGLQLQTAKREELEHDFLWRTTCAFPSAPHRHLQPFLLRGGAGRPRAPGRFLRSQGLPEELRDEKDIWKQRYGSIVDLEKHLHRNGTQIVKIFSISLATNSRNRFLARIDEPDKNWKFKHLDIHERKYWKQYMKAYADCFMRQARIMRRGTSYPPTTRRMRGSSSPRSFWMSWEAQAGLSQEPPQSAASNCSRSKKLLAK